MVRMSASQSEMRRPCVGEAITAVRILIADDHALFRHGLRSLIESSNDDLLVVGEARDGLEAVAMAVELQPDIVLIDLCMPKQNGMESILGIKKRAPDTKIIVVTGHLTEDHVRATLESGADGYVLKEDSREDLLNALAAARQGKVYLSTGICGSVIAGYLGRGSAYSVRSHPESPRIGPDSASVGTSWRGLTTRERQMLKLVAEGKKNREMAELLSLSPKTVEKHRASAMRKMGFAGVSELIAYALEHGLI